jgi:CRP/FNR family transcriptional regulator
MKQEETEMFFNSVRQICPEITDLQLAQFLSLLTFKEHKKKEFFQQAGKIHNITGFVLQGLIRAFFVDQHGNEINISFYLEGDYAMHYPAFLGRLPSQYSLQCLEKTKLLCLTFDDQQWIYSQSPIFERYGRLIAEEILKKQHIRIEGFIFQNAEERYLEFIKFHPHLFNRISLSHLCSYLGIERQTLTRIRQKLAHRKF